MFRINWRPLRLAALAAVLLGVAGCTLREGPPLVSPTKVLSMTGAPVRGDDAKFAFTELSNAPSELVQAMTNEIRRHAAKRRLNIVAEGDPAAVYIVKGYISAIGDDQGALLVYVWDVLDRDGKRLRRISGQQVGGGAKTDPWGGITAETMQVAAREVVDELRAWSD
jgi:hypothetical protein